MAVVGPRSRREALRLGAEATAMVAAFLAGPAALLGGCAMGVPVIDDDRRRSLVLTLASHLIPFTTTPGASTRENADFVLRAVSSGLMGVPTDLLDRAYADVQALSANFLSDPASQQAAAIAALDKATFASHAPATNAWFGVKALILMSYYTSEGGMTQELRYELSPGRYDNDIVIDATFRPLSNDWAAVSIKNKLTA